MKRRLQAWIEAKRLKYQSITESNGPSTSQPEMPCLPNPRPHALTPSASTQDLTVPAQPSPLFDKLPPEIRRAILVVAFGDRTVHMDLILDHPLNPGDPEKAARMPYSHRRPQTNYLVGVDKSQPIRWQWRGCTCHRIPPDHCSFYNDREMEVEEPGDDTCSSGSAVRCIEWTKRGKNPHWCWIGATGWLLACRQAYIEGVQVLYTTNTIHLSSKPLLTNLSTLVLPQRLSAISSLEVVWLVDTRQHLGKAIPRQDDLNAILFILDSIFPHLSRLHLALKLNLPTLAPVHLDDMLKTLDAFVVRRTNCLRDPFTVSITSSAFRELYKKVFNVASQGRRPFQVLDFQFWRYLDGRYAMAPRIRSPSLWGKIDDATARNGYWIHYNYSVVLVTLGS
ncbi:hypothetical protein NM208_g11202 [Fusarium decemcellulare]|uniref:Uncharacterized protein n=1 Tax=Fusarium decemcellulare TaxID=57161 RepID=A0ACC1RV64_9HYPO|nr:hypothetical protein NM208_g11202 [Fusarium decemcellulare]